MVPMPDSNRCPKCGRPFMWDGKRCCRKDCRYGSDKKPLRRRAKVAGVYTGGVEEPVLLIDLVIEGVLDGLDFSEVTQEDLHQPRLNWQVAWDEQLLGESEGKA